MSRAVRVQGIECPIIREGDNIVDIVVDSVLKPFKKEFYTDPENGDDLDTPIVKYVNGVNDKDVVGITESVVARAAGQYITVDDIAADIDKKFGKDATIALINPIYSRNRFSLILKGIARAAKKVIIVMPEYDEVGNPRGVNPFTGVNIEEYYKKLCESENCECVIDYYIHGDRWLDTIDCRLHNAKHLDMPSHTVFTLADICSDKSPDWGVLGTNKATEEKLKLFPSKAEAQRVCDEVKAKIKEKTGKDVIVCVYGDGCFKDPIGGIWEFADPVTMPAYTDKELMESSPCEVKLKYMIDMDNQVTEENNYGVPRDLQDESLNHMLSNIKRSSNKGIISQGTTPRIYRDLLASLMDLTSGSGDRATPVILVQNYF